MRAPAISPIDISSLRADVRAYLSGERPLSAGLPNRLAELRLRPPELARMLFDAYPLLQPSGDGEQRFLSLLTSTEAAMLSKTTRSAPSTNPNNRKGGL